MDHRLQFRHAQSFLLGQLPQPYRLAIQAPHCTQYPLVQLRQFTDRLIQLVVAFGLQLRFLLFFNGCPFSRDQLCQGVAIVSNRGVKAANTPSVDQQLIEHLQADAKLFGQLEPGGVTVQFLAQAAADAGQLGEVLAMAARDGDDPRLGIYPVVHRLANPPVGVGAEAIAPCRVILLHRTDQADVRGLHQIINAVRLGQTVAVLADVGDRQAEVGRYKALLGTLAAATDASRAGLRPIRVIEPGLHGAA